MSRERRRRRQIIRTDLAFNVLLASFYHFIILCLPNCTSPSYFSVAVLYPTPPPESPPSTPLLKSTGKSQFPTIWNTLVQLTLPNKHCYLYITKLHYRLIVISRPPGTTWLSTSHDLQHFDVTVLIFFSSISSSSFHVDLDWIGCV